MRVKGCARGAAMHARCRASEADLSERACCRWLNPASGGRASG